MSAKRPYLLRALYEWIVDNQLTPHIVVDATLPQCQVPLEFVQDGQIILNIAPAAVGALQMTNTEVQFNARFGGKPMQVWIPMAAVVAVYARENGAGTIFELEASYQSHPEAATQSAPDDTTEHVKVVEDSAPAATSDREPKKSSGAGSKKPRKGGHLKLIK